MKLLPARLATFSRSPGAINTAPAPVVSTCGRYFWLARNASCAGPALSSGARLPTACAPSPTTSPPKRFTSSSSVIAMPDAISSQSSSVRARERTRAGRARGQRLQHLIRDVDARTHVHRLLHDQIVVLL